MEQELHVIFGAGQVGVPLAERLLGSGKRVRVVKRSPDGIPAGAEPMPGDAADPAFCTRAAAGAAVVYHCMNPPYSTDAWAALLPAFIENLVAAAGRAGARLVVLDNLYLHGPTGGRPINEDTPINPCSRKGEIRAEVSEHLFDAHRRGDVRALVGRASDFYGPGAGQTHFGDLFWKPALSGKTVRLLIEPDVVHTYHYIPDVVEGLALLGEAEEDVLGVSWMLPCRPAETARDLAARFSRVLGREIRVRGIPRWITKSLGFFVPLVREVGEMLYQWDEPFVVDDGRFRKRFSVEPTGRSEAAERTVAWAKKTYEPHA